MNYLSPQIAQGLMDEVSKERPRVGIRVVVMRGKHAKKTGIVFWHGPKSHFHSYGSPMSDMLRDARGTYGFRVGIKTKTERFFVDADNVQLIDEIKP